MHTTFSYSSHKQCLAIQTNLVITRTSFKEDWNTAHPYIKVLFFKNTEGCQPSGYQDKPNYTVCIILLLNIKYMEKKSRINEDTIKNCI